MDMLILKISVMLDHAPKHLGMYLPLLKVLQCQILMGFSRKSQNSKNNFYILCAFCKILKSLLMVFPTAIASYF